MDGLIELFEYCTNINYEKPLTPKILKNTEHVITKSLLKAYTSESLGLYHEINKLMRSDDFFNNNSIIEQYGPYIVAISYTIQHSSCYKKKSQILYRGV